jgi:hypothetical protein
MATREEFLAYVTTKIGTTEHPVGSNCQEFSEKLGKPCGPWAEDFILASLEDVGISGFDSLDSLEKNADITSGLEPGDIVLFDTVLPFTRPHSGVFVRYIDDFTVETIEGNTSSGNAGSQDDGEGVYKRNRPLLSIISASRPPYTDE